MPLAKKIGKPGLQSQIYKYLNGGVDEPARSTAEPIAAYFNIPVDALYDERIAAVVAQERQLNDENNQGFPTLIARSVSQETLSIDLQEDSVRVRWGSMNYADLPDEFLVEVPDNAMADRVKKGYLVKFDKLRTPRADEGVLVANAAGEWFFRQYIPGPGGTFTAAPLNKDYPTLSSQEHGLQVLGVRVWHRSDETWG